MTRWYKPWFYKHVEGFLAKGKDYEYIPLEDYLLRHNKSIFWVVETMIPFGNNPIFRFFLGWLLPPKIAFLKFTTTPGVRAMTFTKQVSLEYRYLNLCFLAELGTYGYNVGFVLTFPIYCKLC